jgi:hypothetical protein
MASLNRRVAVIEVWNKKQRQTFALIGESTGVDDTLPYVMKISDPNFETEAGENSDECIGLAKVPMIAIAQKLQV